MLAVATYIRTVSSVQVYGTKSLMEMPRCHICHQISHVTVWTPSLFHSNSNRARFEQCRGSDTCWMLMIDAISRLGRICRAYSCQFFGSSGVKVLKAKAYQNHNSTTRIWSRRRSSYYSIRLSLAQQRLLLLLQLVLYMYSYRYTQRPITKATGRRLSRQAPRFELTSRIL